MKRFAGYVWMLFLISIVSGCCRTGEDFWDDTHSATRHMTRGIKTFFGYRGESRQVYDRDAFMCPIDDEYSDFVPLQDQDVQDQIAITEARRLQPSQSPGEPGSSIPTIEHFKDPASMGHLGGVFRHVHFAYDSSLVKGKENLEIIRNAAKYLAAHPNTYVFVEGHCDERGPQAYNFALGSRRANTVRNLLIKEGVNPDNAFTISYGKDRPLIQDHREESWTQNRRAEFKIYQKR